MIQAQREQRETALLRSQYRCAVCGKPINEGQAQFAHRIANTKANRRKYGEFIIGHTMNGEYVCSLQCNAKMNIANNKGKVLELLDKILRCEIVEFRMGKTNKDVKE